MRVPPEELGFGVLAASGPIPWTFTVTRRSRSWLLPVEERGLSQVAGWASSNRQDHGTS